MRLEIGTHDFALVLAGIIGSAVAIVHGVLVQRMMVRPVAVTSSGKLRGATLRLIAALLHFSTFNWFVGGLALICTALAFGTQAKIAVGVLVGSSYLFGALGNLWATRGRHPGWVLYGITVGLIVYGLLGRHG